MISRRRMLLTTVAGIAGIAGAALLPSTPVKAEKKWERYHDDLWFTSNGNASMLPPAAHPDYKMGIHSLTGLDRILLVYPQPGEKLLVEGRLCDMVEHKPRMFIMWKPTQLPSGAFVWEAVEQGKMPLTFYGGKQTWPCPNRSE